MDRLNHLNVLKARIQELERQVTEGEDTQESLALYNAQHKTIIDNPQNIFNPWREGLDYLCYR